MVNPVGFGSMMVASAVSIAAYFGAFGEYLAAFSPLLALVIAVALVPLLAVATKGSYYLARENTVRLAEAETLATHVCAVCGDAYEVPDVADCVLHQGPICSLCCTLDATGHDACQDAGPVTLPMPTVRGAGT